MRVYGAMLMSCCHHNQLCHAMSILECQYECFIVRHISCISDTGSCKTLFDVLLAVDAVE